MVIDSSPCPFSSGNAVYLIVMLVNTLTITTTNNTIFGSPKRKTLNGVASQTSKKGYLNLASKSCNGKSSSVKLR